jgi:hypothetical protein
MKKNRKKELETINNIRIIIQLGYWIWMWIKEWLKHPPLAATPHNACYV